MTNDAKNGSVQGQKAVPQKQTYPVTCSECATATTVPFKPSADRPVYCADCFTKRRATQNPLKKNTSNGGQNNTQPQNRQHNGAAVGLGEIKRSLDILNSKLDRLIQAAEATPKKVAKKTVAKKKAVAKKK